MGMEKKLGLMVENTKVTTGTLKRMGLEHSFGLMATCIRETGEMISKMGKEFTLTSRKELRDEENGRRENEPNGLRKLR